MEDFNIADMILSLDREGVVKFVTVKKLQTMNMYHPRLATISKC